jgi:hypothetical protein
MASRSKKTPQNTKKSGQKSLKSLTGLTELINNKNELKTKHGSAENTRKTYERALRQGKEWLKIQCAAEANFEVPEGCPDMPSSSEWSIEELSHAFDPIPNRASPSALALFIAHRCFQINLKKGIAQQAHAAFKKYWDMS